MKKDFFPSCPLSRINAYEAHKKGILGQGIGIAVLDTGVYPHPDFLRCSSLPSCSHAYSQQFSPSSLCLQENHPASRSAIAAFSDFITGKQNPYDDANHGTHICGILASSGQDLCGRYRGIAPGCHLICAKILDASGNGKTATAIAAFQWICQLREQYNIRIINISMGMTVESPMDEFSPFMKAVEELWDEGFVVVAAAGNNGPGAKTITAPGIGRKLITVGSCEDSFSGRGPTINCIKKPDICAPGKNIYSCANYGRDYIYKSGTSMSTPMASAAAALLLSVEPNLTNKEVKRRLLSSARDLHLPWQQQGAGLLDIKKLLRL